MKQLDIITGIYIYSNGFVDRTNKYLKYKLINNKMISDYEIKLPRYERPEMSEKIINISNIKNGYYRVQTANGEFGYVNVENGLLLPYRYDIASDFNDYGYAMVGKDSAVAWIDKDFNPIYGESKCIGICRNCFEIELWEKIITNYIINIGGSIYNGQTWKKLDKLKKIAYEMQKTQNPILLIGKQEEKSAKIKK